MNKYIYILMFSVISLALVSCEKDDHDGHDHDDDHDHIAFVTNR